MQEDAISHVALFALDAQTRSGPFSEMIQNNWALQEAEPIQPWLCHLKWTGRLNY